MAQASEEVQTDFRAIEDRRLAWEKECKEAEEKGKPMPSSAGVELRNVEELRADIEVQRTNLEMNLITNPGIVEQYEKRLRDVSFFFCSDFFLQVAPTVWLHVCLSYLD